jgi:hypothetical protein
VLDEVHCLLAPTSVRLPWTWSKTFSWSIRPRQLVVGSWSRGKMLAPCFPEYLLQSCCRTNNPSKRNRVRNTEWYIAWFSRLTHTNRWEIAGNPLSSLSLRSKR